MSVAWESVSAEKFWVPERLAWRVYVRMRHGGTRYGMLPVEFQDHEPSVVDVERLRDRAWFAEICDAKALDFDYLYELWP